MIVQQVHVPAATKPGRTTVRNVLAIVGTLLAIGLVVGAGAGAWFAVERYVLEPQTAAATDKDGLPTAHLDVDEPWRSFHYTSERAGGSLEAWVDLDAGETRFVAEDADVTIEFERGAEAAYVEVPEGWVVVADAEAVSRTANLARQVGPFLLTDQVPPAALDHVTVVADDELDGVRILELTIDKASFERTDPYNYRRWLDRSDELPEDPHRRTLHVRSDGYVVGIDRALSKARWSDLTTPVPLESPLAGPDRS